MRRQQRCIVAAVTGCLLVACTDLALRTPLPERDGGLVPPSDSQDDASVFERPDERDAPPSDPVGDAGAATPPGDRDEPPPDAPADDGGVEPPDAHVEPPPDVPPDTDVEVDAGPEPEVDPSIDTDDDGLPDGYERHYQAQGQPLDPLLRDTDGDGIDDADEDEDGDGLSTLQELAALQLDPIEEAPASPFHKDLLIELDWMRGHAPSDELFETVWRVFDTLRLDNLDGVPGIRVHFYVDEVDLPEESFPDVAGTKVYLAAHPPSWERPPAHVERMLHVVLALDDDIERGRTQGYTIYDSAVMDIERTGVVLLGRGARNAYDGLLVGACAADTLPVPITLEEARGATLAHEIGHALQADHEGPERGGFNYFNLMATAGDIHSCSNHIRRFRGTGNRDDRALGANEADGHARFSDDSAAQLDLLKIVSVDVPIQITREGV